MPDTIPSAPLPAIDRARLDDDLDRQGWHVVRNLLPPQDCLSLRQCYDREALYRSTVHMRRHGFGSGEYRYFRYPLPAPVDTLRAALYPPLASIANDWARRLRQDMTYSPDHAAFLDHCHAVGQQRPTPLILRYRVGDYNCLHQDLYGDVHFPLQAAILLSCPQADFEGGEFILTEQRPRMQSRVHAVPLGQGDAVIFAVNEAPRQGSRGTYRVKLRHGVSEVRRGERFTLGIIFHDAN